MARYIVQATHGSLEHPLCIGTKRIPCYVLEDGRRVLIQGEVIKSLDLAPGGSASEARNQRLAEFATQMGIESEFSQGKRLARFIAGKSLQPYVSRELLNAILNPIEFKTPNGTTAFDYEATILADICEAVLKARQDNHLNQQQHDIAIQCEILVRGFARVGIIALVDEATGYQEFRARQALEEILKKFISPELLKWAKTFPDEFYRELYRLRGLSYQDISTKRPMYLGNITNDIIYARLAPGILQELQEITPKTEAGRRKHKFFQRLTDDIGHPELHNYISNVILLMKVSAHWKEFYRLLERGYPRFDAPPKLPFEFVDDQS